MNCLLCSNRNDSSERFFWMLKYFRQLLLKPLTMLKLLGAWFSKTGCDTGNTARNGVFPQTEALRLLDWNVRFRFRKLVFPSTESLRIFVFPLHRRRRNRTTYLWLKKPFKIQLGITGIGFTISDTGFSITGIGFKLVLRNTKPASGFQFPTPVFQFRHRV